jgi:hypothetical protein
MDYLKDVSACLGKEVILTPENYSEEDKKLIIVNKNGIKLDFQDFTNLKDYPNLNHLNQDKIKKDSTKSLSIISLAILLFLLIWNIVPIIQVRMQLISNFIPNSLIYDIAKPFIYISSILFLVNIIAHILFFKKKYITPVILCGITLFLHGLYFFFNHFL